MPSAATSPTSTTPATPRKRRPRPRPRAAPGRNGSEPDGGAAGIPLDELLPLAAAGEPVQPAAPQPVRHRRAFVAPQERLDLPRRDTVEGLAQPRVFDVGKQRIVAEALAQPFPRVPSPRRRTFRFDERGADRGVRRRRTCGADGGRRRAGCPGDRQRECDHPPAGAGQRRRTWRHLITHKAQLALRGRWKPGHRPCKSLSFPRKRESKGLLLKWTPAFSPRSRG